MRDRSADTLRQALSRNNVFGVAATLFATVGAVGKIGSQWLIVNCVISSQIPIFWAEN